MNLSGKTILITGGCGLIGSTLADRLLAQEPTVRILLVDNLTRGTRRNVEPALASGRVELIKEDIRRFARIRPYFDGVDGVFHQAAIRITQCAQEPRECVEVLIDGTLNVLEACVEAGVKKVVAASSASIYGMAEVFPTPETHHPYNNRTLYGAAKIANEGMLRSFNDMYGLPYVALRYFNVYGPRMDVHGKYTEVLIRWLDCIDRGETPKIFGDGTQTMDFVFADDVARANCLAMTSEVSDQVLNVASGVETSLLELLDALLRVTGHPEVRPEFAPPRAVNPVPRRLADICQAERLLGFTAQIGLEEGMRRLVDWRRALLAESGREAAQTPNPAFDSPREAAAVIPLTRPCFDEAEALAAKAAVESGWVTQGPKVAEFERGVAAVSGTAEAVAVCNCTAALHLSLLVLGIGPGDEVVCPSLSFIATANSIWQAGARPVFVDVEPRTYNLDPDAARAALTPRTKAILVVHQIGQPADLDRFLAIGAETGVKILEDAACAIGARYKGRPIGGHSEMACFSFHPRKVITTGEGGAITTNNPEYARQLRLLRQHGMSISDVARHKAERVVVEEYVSVGYNNRLTDIQAAIGIEQLKKLEVLVARRRELAARYAAALESHPWLGAPFVADYAEPTFQSYAIELADDAPMNRDELIQHLLDRKISARRGIMLTHLEPAYSGQFSGHLPVSERASARSLLLPLYPQMTLAEQDLVISALFQAAEKPPTPTGSRTSR